MNQWTAILNDPQLAALFKSGGLLLARILPIIILTPMLGGNLLPKRLRIGVSMLLVLALLPALSPAVVGAANLSGITYFLYFGKELLIGLTMAKMIDLLYQTFVAFGSIVDLSRGATIASVFDPISQQQESILGLFFMQCGIVLFLALGGHMVVIEALADSVTTMPPTQLLPARLQGATAVTQILVLFGEMLIVAVKLAAPVLAVILLLDVVLGLLNRVAPQVQVYFLGLTAKSFLGLLIVFMSIIVVMDLFREHMRTVLRAIRQWISG
ncbi:MAG: flagellar biosynthetic protein FliR [Phycisphaeraceae bacterium]